MDQCPKCTNDKICRDGKIKSKQRYKCKTCNYRFTVESKGKSIITKRDTFILYLLGLSPREIAKLVNVSHVTVSKWIKSPKEIKAIHKMTEIIDLEVEELTKYIHSRKNLSEHLFVIEIQKQKINIFIARKR